MIEPQGKAGTRVTCDHCLQEIKNKFSGWFRKWNSVINVTEDFCKHCWENREKD